VTLSGDVALEEGLGMLGGKELLSRWEQGAPWKGTLPWAPGSFSEGSAPWSLNLYHLAESLRRIFSQYTDDPGPRQVLDGWRKTAEIC
jgi:hypothetical protein